ncbi:class I SAM-dependent methyltransferase [Pantoea agglomerans]|uniref:class I SAM-dependent methyltransferase n=1 Tax=Enterobacter agglomerans TaxID=549 RepID=UPI00106502C5|nr:class I SAM-dependent methyltransferase [Pantoea agglomerans]NKE96096.1 class I SAM-dependent methyltransferase [Pantoea agglomerans]TRO72738.1 class I SAM-dependent methyltransferase [Pantoea agglomerans]
MLINHELYAKRWEKESDLMESKGVYEWLASLTPEGNVLEFGCGAGQSTRYLLNHHSVLSLENNEYLINSAKENLVKHGCASAIHQCDFFTLSESDKQLISDFAPKVIVGWLIGGSGVDQLKQVPTVQNPAEMSKKYREKIEDIIASPEVCIDSVEYIQLASRGHGIAGADKNDVFIATKADYDQFVFNPVGFEVITVESMSWAHEESTFTYGHAHNPNFAGGKKVETVPLVTSILAKRISK